VLSDLPGARNVLDLWWCAIDGTHGELDAADHQSGDVAAVR